MCNGPQMDSKSTNSREQTDIAEKVIGFDGFNNNLTGGIAMTITGQRADCKHIPTVFTLKIRGGCEVDSYGKKAGKGALIHENMAMTLGVSQDQTLFVPKFINSSGGGIAGTLDANYYKGCGVREGIEREFIAVKKR